MNYCNIVTMGDNEIDSLIRNRIEFCWVVALRAEAVPIIEAFNMKIFSNDLLYPIYLNQDNGHALIISGVGAIKSGAAATFLKVYLSIQNYAAWINIGIAGYFEDAKGELYQAIKVSYQDTGNTFFPGMRFSRILKSEVLRTVGKPQKDFSEPALYDMEAAGFCEISTSFSCNELTYVFKVVSDGPNHSSNLLTKKSVSNLIENQLPKIFEISDAIEKLVAVEKKRIHIPIEAQEILKTIHFSVTNRNVFINTYRRWKAKFPNKYLAVSEFVMYSPKQIINHMEKQLSSETDSWIIQ